MGSNLARRIEVHSYTFRGIANRSGASNDTEAYCVSCALKRGFMSGRPTISVDIKQKKYAGEYEIDCGVLYVFFEGRSKSSAVTSPGTELLARLLLIELIFQVPNWHAHPLPAMTSHPLSQG